MKPPHIFFISLALWGIGGCAPSVPITESVRQIQVIRTPRDLNIWVQEDFSRPFFSLEIAFRDGSLRDPEGKEGVAMLAGLYFQKIIEKNLGGTPERLSVNSNPHSLRHYNVPETTSAALGFNVDFDSFSVKIISLSDEKQKAFEKIRLALATPMWDKKIFEQIRQDHLETLKAKDNPPEDIAHIAVLRAIFGKKSYGRLWEGTVDSVQRIEMKDIQEFHAGLSKKRMMISAVGAISAQDLEAVLDPILGSFPEDTFLPPLVMPELSLQKNIKICVPFDTVQAKISFASPSLSRKNKDYLKTNLLNYPLGGDIFNSYLFKELRVQRGLVYYVYSSVLPYHYTGLWWGEMGTDPEKLDETLLVFQKTLDKYAHNPLNHDELSRSKKYVLGSYPLKHASASQMTSLISLWQLEHMPPDYMHKRVERINSFTLDDMNRIKSKFFAPALGKYATAIVTPHCPKNSDIIWTVSDLLK